MSSILIIGSQGQMGLALQAALERSKHAVVALDRHACEISNRAKVIDSVNAYRPDFVVNTAAMTVVDRSEVAPALAYAINRDGPAHLAEACAQFGARLIHLSTDYVFGQPIGRPFVESDLAAPLNVYGASKAAGEAAIVNRLDNHLILRTSWVYGQHSQNFFMTMMRLAETHETIKVVSDEQSCPTYANDLAELIVHIVDHEHTGAKHRGILHACGTQSASRLDFARAIMAARGQAGLKVANLVPTTQKAFAAPALRPINSTLDCHALQLAYGRTLRGFGAVLPALVQQIAEGGAQ
jgi:dTDP-4-dehydrorhamnose reductase